MAKSIALWLLLCGVLIAGVLLGCGQDYIDRPTKPVVAAPCEPETVYVYIKDDD